MYPDLNDKDVYMVPVLLSPREVTALTKSSGQPNLTAAVGTILRNYLLLTGNGVHSMRKLVKHPNSLMRTAQEIAADWGVWFDS